MLQLREMSRSNPSYRWIVLVVATIAQAAASFVMQGLGVLAGFLQQDLQLSSFQVGLLMAASTAAPILALPIVGDLLDRRSERMIVGTGAAILALGLVLSALAPNFACLLASLFIVGCGYSTTQPGGSKSVTAWFRGDQLGFAMGIRQAGLPLGGAAAAAALPIIASMWSWRLALVVGAAIALVGALGFSALYRAPVATGEMVRQNRPRMSLASFLTMLRHPWMRGVVLSGTSLVGAQSAILTYFMLFLRDGAVDPIGGWCLAYVRRAVVRHWWPYNPCRLERPPW